MPDTQGGTTDNLDAIALDIANAEAKATEALTDIQRIARTAPAWRALPDQPDVEAAANAVSTALDELIDVLDEAYSAVPRATATPAKEDST